MKAVDITDKYLDLNALPSLNDILESNSFESAINQSKVNLDYIQLRKIHEKEIYSLIDKESDKEFFLNLLDSLDFLNKKLPNIYFNSAISVPLKEKAKESNKIKIAFQKLTYFSKIRLDQEDPFSLKNKLINYLFSIHISETNNQSKNDNLSNILHLIIFPYNNLEEFSPRKKNNHTITNYAFLICKPSLENELGYFLEAFRDFNYLRMSISPQSIPKFSFSNLSILTLNYIRYIRGFLEKKGELNNNGNKINEKLIRISNNLNYEGLSVKNLEFQTKLEEYNYCKVYMIDFSNLEEDYMNDLINRLIIFSQIITLISPTLFYLMSNFDYGSIILNNNLLIVNFQAREVIKESTIKSEQSLPVKLYTQIIKNIRKIMTFKNFKNSSLLALSPKLKENLNFYERTLSAKKNFPIEFDSPYKNDIKKFVCQFNEEKLINEINIYFKKIGFNIARKDSYLRNSDLILNEVKKVNFLLDERLLKKKNFQQILSSSETSTFFGRTIKFFLEKMKRISVLIENIDRSVAYKIVDFFFDEVFSEFSSDFSSLLDLAISFLANHGLSSDFEFLLFILYKLFHSNYLRKFFEFIYAKNLENCLNMHDLSENSFETFYMILEILFDLDNLKKIPNKFLGFLLNLFSTVEENFDDEKKYSLYAKVLWGAVFLPFYQNLGNDENQLITIKKMKIKQILFVYFENQTYFSTEDAIKLTKHFLFELKSLLETGTKEEPTHNNYEFLEFNKSPFLNFERIIITNKNLLIFFRAIKNVTTLALEELSNFLNFSINVSKYEKFLTKNIEAFLEIDLIDNNEGNEDNMWNLFKKEKLLSSHFLNKFLKISPDVRLMNDHGIINKNKKFKKIVFQKVNDNFLHVRNIYFSIYNLIEFRKIDKRISYLRELVEYVEVFFEKNRFSRANEDIEYLIEKVKKHEDQITSYINLCYYTFKDLQILSK